MWIVAKSDATFPDNPVWASSNALAYTAISQGDVW